MPSHPDVQLALLIEQRRREFREVADLRAAASSRPGRHRLALLTGALARFRARQSRPAEPMPAWRVPSRIPGATVGKAAS